MQDSIYKLGVALVQQKVVKFETLKEALKVKQDETSETRRNLAQILIDDFKVNEDSVSEQVARFYGFKIQRLPEKLDDQHANLIRKILRALPEDVLKLIQRERILVYQYNKAASIRWLLVAVDPTNQHISDVARAIGAKRYEIRFIRPSDFKRIMEEVYSPENEFLKSLEESDIEIGSNEEGIEELLDEQAIDAEINRSLLINLVEGMLVEAVRVKASDIHVVPIDANSTQIHFRVDGQLQHWHTQRNVRPEAMIAVVKDRSKNVDRFEREMSQDGFIQRKVDNHTIRYRVSVVPIVGREFRFKLESVVIRILDDRNVITDFSKLGFMGHALNSFKKSISQPQGMVIVTGPTGSGKSTTLLAALSYIIRPEINVLTVEDPVEYVIPGVRQLKIGPKNNFDQALRAILRHDPDVVMVGEIRDKVTAETGIKLANTGHLTFSTLHTNDAPSAISRLYKIGIEPFLIAYAINIIIAQRLMRRLCDKCKRPIDKSDKVLLEQLGFTPMEIQQHDIYEPVGCKACHAGYKGRIAIHEALYFSKEIRRMIFKAGADIDEAEIKRLAIEEGMLTLRAAARERVKKGHTSLNELTAVTSDD